MQILWSSKISITTKNFNMWKVLTNSNILYSAVNNCLFVGNTNSYENFNSRPSSNILLALLLTLSLYLLLFLWIRWKGYKSHKLSHFANIHTKSKIIRIRIEEGIFVWHFKTYTLVLTNANISPRQFKNWRTCTVTDKNGMIYKNLN